jgi:hypothetical protein
MNEGIAQDMMRTPAPSMRRSGLVAAALQASIPLGLFVLAKVLFSLRIYFAFSYLFDISDLFVAGGFGFYLLTFERIFLGNIYSGFTTGDLLGSLLPPFLLTLLPLVGTGAIDFVVSRRTTQATGSLRAGLRTCLWGHAGYIAAPLAIIVYGYRGFPFGFDAPRASYTSIFFEALAVFLLMQIGLALGVSQICGRWGGAHGLRARGGAESAPALEAGDPAAVRDLATRSNLGAFVRVFTPLDTSTVILRGLGLIVFFVVLLLVQRFVFHVTGTEPCLTTVVGVVGTIGYMVQVARRRGQPIYVFQDGLVGFTDLRRLVAMRWDEMQPLSTRSPLRLTSRNGEQIVAPDTLAHVDELEDLIRQGVTRVAMARQ